MTTIRRVVVVLAALVSIALAGAGGVHAADPTDTIGITIDPGVVRVDDGRTFAVVNRGTVPMDFTFVLPEGWTVEPSTLTLDAHEIAHVRLDGNGADGVMTVSGTASHLVSSVGVGDRSVIAMEVRLVGGSPWPVVRNVLFALVVILAVAFLLWRTKPWQIRLTRATR